MYPTLRKRRELNIDKHTGMVTPLRVDRVPLGFSAFSFGEDDAGELILNA